MKTTVSDLTKQYLKNTSKEDRTPSPPLEEFAHVKVRRKSDIIAQQIATSEMDKMNSSRMVSAAERREKALSIGAKPGGIGSTGELLDIEGQKSLLKKTTPLKIGREIIGTIFALGLIGDGRVPLNALHKDGRHITIESPYLAGFVDIGHDFKKELYHRHQKSLELL